MILRFNALGALIDITTHDEPLRQGNAGSNTLNAIFEGKNNVNYTAVFSFTRSDGSFISDIPMTADGQDITKYKYTFDDPWFFALDGTTTCSIKLVNSAGTTVVSGQVTFNIEKTDFSHDDPQITISQMNALLAAIAAKLNLTSAIISVPDHEEIVASEYEDGQVFFDRTDKIFYKINNGQVEVFLEVYSKSETLALVNGVLNQLNSHINNKNNPHEVTKAQVGLGNVNNTSDTDKPVSTAQRQAINGVDTKVDTHIANKNNPHQVTKTQVGLDNVDNVKQYPYTSGVNLETTKADKSDTYTKNEVDSKESVLQSGIDSINNKIPSQASESNKLADKDFVNSSIATATATFRGTFTSLADLQATSGDLNDYAFYAHTDSAGNTVYDRYKYTANTPHWVYEYTLNNSSFTSAQWASINSGITSALVEQITQNKNDIIDINNRGYITGITGTMVTEALGYVPLRASVLDNYYNKGEINGLLADKQNVIDEDNKLNIDLLDETNTTKKTVTAGEKTAWNGKQDNLGLSIVDGKICMTY